MNRQRVTRALECVVGVLSILLAITNVVFFLFFRDLYNRPEIIPLAVLVVVDVCVVLVLMQRRDEIKQNKTVLVYQDPEIGHGNLKKQEEALSLKHPYGYRNMLDECHSIESPCKANDECHHNGSPCKASPDSSAGSLLYGADDPRGTTTATEGSVGEPPSYDKVLLLSSSVLEV